MLQDMALSAGAELCCATCRQAEHSMAAAKRTLELMRELVGVHRHESHVSLIAHVKEVGVQLIRARPQGAPALPHATKQLQSFCRRRFAKRLLDGRTIATQELQLDFDVPAADLTTCQMVMVSGVAGLGLVAAFSTRKPTTQPTLSNAMSKPYVATD